MDVLLYLGAAWLALDGVVVVGVLRATRRRRETRHAAVPVRLRLVD
jgi:hypothetical protein